ncbi:hypothetical protein DLJ61_23595 [Gordonia terrae]|uniref:WXG100 family type VII secretion target n=3 Tax=Gordonia terrae TaxID=2055 RepID=A0AAD0KD02_9ACTN|nr:hypothetical protein BCM27_23345 [Gordonia terrae]AWO86100.1 hypothetical protein DLJ61_23595 [Gordonia terrae]GAB42147.1 hypothetical protein GOTRE_009_00300 [Gordonia terrae NBRC 100016]VTR08256.1 Uncharacterised protein [Clostridioides difficile]VTS62895.1 Uncharacterised protein [Gordonia terrae]
MPPSYNDVLSWNPDVMTSIANGIVRLQAHLEVEAPKAGDPVINLTRAQWTGVARGPADDRAEGITRWIRGVADEFGDLASVLTNGQSSIRDAMKALETRTTLADSDGYILDRGSREYTVNFDESRAPDDAKFDAGKAFEHHSALLGLGTAADNAVTAARDGINSALGELGGITPAANAVNRGIVDANLAASDATAVRNGTATPEQRGRFLRAMNLTPEQLEKLKSGQPIDVDPSRLEYFKNALGLAPGSSLAGPAATAAISAIQRRGEDIAAAYSRPRRAFGQAGMTPADVTRMNSVGKAMAKGSFLLGLGVTGYDEYSKYARGEQDGGDATAAVAGSVGGGIIAGAAAGAVVGTFAGPVGTAIGAGIGAAIGSKAGADAAKVVKGWFD